MIKQNEIIWRCRSLGLVLLYWYLTDYCFNIKTYIINVSNIMSYQRLNLQPPKCSCCDHKHNSSVCILLLR